MTDQIKICDVDDVGGAKTDTVTFSKLPSIIRGQLANDSNSKTAQAIFFN